MVVAYRIYALILAAVVVVPVVLFAQTSVPQPVTPEQVAAVCAEAKSAAALRGFPDGPTTVANFGPSITDTCVAAVLNPAVQPLNPRSPASYMCVGKRANVSISSTGLITMAYVPDRTVAAGKCDTTACTKYNAETATCQSASSATPVSTYRQRFYERMMQFLYPGQDMNSIPSYIGIRG